MTRPFSALAADRKSQREDAPCPLCGKFLCFPVSAERTGCPACGAAWIRPVTSTRPLAFSSSDRHILLHRREVGRVFRPQFPFQHALFHEPKIQELRKRHPVVRHLKGRTQWEQQRTLLRLLRTELFPCRPPTSVLRHLGLWTVCRTNRFWFCSHYAYLYTVFAAAAGWVARILNVGADHAANSNPHMVCEVWNDEFQKWVVLDPLLVAWFSHRRQPGVPLGFLEVRQAGIANGGRDLMVHYGVEEDACRHEICEERTMPASRHPTVLNPSVYFWGVALLSNRFLTDPYVDRSHLVLLWRDRWNGKRPWRHQNKVVSYFSERRLVETTSPDNFNPPLNHVAVWIRHSKTEAPRIFLKTLMPNFSHFEMSASGPWRRIPAEFPMPLRKGSFDWRFRARNHFGVAGHPAKFLGTVAPSRVSKPGAA